MQLIPNITGNPPSSKPIYERLFCFIDNNLSDFKPFSKKDNGSTVTSEDDITEDLVEYLETQQELLMLDRSTAFRFINQSKQGDRKTDIGVRLGRNYIKENRPLFCWIEAKRLPTPDAGTKRDEREYVVVSDERVNGKKKFNGNGGIQRFKENNHAPNLPYSIMIGYIQENDSDYWLNKINGWIKELISENSAFWNENDCLCKHKIKKCDCYISVHSRKTDLSSIILFHFWIKL